MAEGNQGFGLDSVARQGEADPEPRSTYAGEVRLEQVLPAGHGTAVPLDARRQDLGKGNLWGVGQFGQSVGVFYNKTLLKQYGGEPEQHADDVRGLQQAARARCAAKAPFRLPDHRARQQGRLRVAARLRHGAGRLRPGASSCATGSSTSPGSDYSAPANVKALTEFQTWFKNGYFGSDYNAVDENDASAAFAKGKGVFYLGGNWQAQVIQSGLKGARSAFMDMPPGPSGKYVFDRRDEPALAHLVEDEVPRCRRGVHQLADLVQGLGGG